VIRTLWVYLVGGVVTFVFAAATVLRTYVWRRNIADACDRAARRWGRILLWASGARVVLEGAANLREDEPQIIVSNHQSWFDVFALAACLPVRYRFVAKQELRRIPVFGKAWRRCGHVSVDRGDRASAIESLDEAWREVQDQKLTLVFFAEGTRSPDGSLKPFKKGAFVLALQARVPIVPMGIVGSRDIMPKGAMKIRPGSITIRVGEAIPTEALLESDRNRLMEESWTAVHALMGEGPEVVEPVG
jgi:1-acyl-sn-glycerol-3-phosphate acyltransferase